jgi:K+-sensing histidine kinase KdpD
MISDHGGRIEAGDSAEGGARFLVTFPAQGEGDDEAERRAEG